MKKAHRDKVRGRLARVRAILDEHWPYLERRLNRTNRDAVARLLWEDIPALLDELDRHAAVRLARRDTAD